MIEVSVQKSVVAVANNLVSVSTSSTVSQVGLSPTQVINVDTTREVAVITTGQVRSINDLDDVNTTGKIDKSLLIYDSGLGVFSTASGITTENLPSDGGDF